MALASRGVVGVLSTSTSLTEKAWVLSAPVSCVTPLSATYQLDEARGRARVLRAVKDALVGTSAWVVRGSSDGATAGLDGVDRWLSDASLAWAASPTGARSWLVLRHGAAPFEVLFDLVTAGATTAYHQWTCKVSRAGFSGGLVGSAPAAVDEAILTARHAWTEEVVTGFEGAVVHASRATDGSAYRVWWSGYNAGRAEVLGFLSFEYLRDPAAPMIGAMIAMTSRGRPTAVGAGADLGVHTYSADPIASRAHVAGVTTDGRAWSGNLTWEGFNGLPANRTLLLANEVTDEQRLYPISVYSQTPSLRGYMGRLQDLWIGSALLPAGTAFPSDRSRQLLSLGGLIVPWSGAIPTFM